MNQRSLSGHRMMWLLVLFDLPVGTKQERKATTQFRHFLLDEGFEMTQFSSYLRFCATRGVAATVTNKIERQIPCAGRVHIISITDKQYAQIITFRGKQKIDPEKPSQFVLL